MATKEKKPALIRQLTKESLEENDKSVGTVLPTKKRGRKTQSDKVKQTPDVPVKRGRRKTELALTSAAAEDSKQSPLKNKKTFLEKELEDILENATGRNTPLEDKTGLFLAKARREPDDDTLSVRSLSTFSRTRRGGELEDDVLSLRSLKVRTPDDDNVSVLSMSGRPIRKPAKRTVDVKPTVKAGRPKKSANTKKGKTTKTKNKKKTQPIRLATKIGPKQRSTMIAKKKVMNAKKAVKQIFRKKAILKEKTAMDAANVQIEPTVPAKGSESERETQVSVAERNGNAEEQPKKRRRLIREPPATPNGMVRRKRGRWESEIHFDTTQCPEDASVIIVHPRLGPKAKKAVMETETVLTPEVGHTPVTESATTANGTNSSATPYFIQTVSNFNALKSQPTAQGDWLVTPSGVVLIQAVQPDRNGVKAEGPVEMAVAPVSDIALSPAGLNGAGVHTPHPSPVSLSSNAISLPFGSHLETSHSLSVSAVVPASQTGAVHAASSGVAVSEKAETAGTSRLPRIPVAKNVQDLLALKSEIVDQEGAEPFDGTKKLPVNNLPKSNATERRASHDGSFGPMPNRVLRRFGSCDRLAPRSPRSILQLGSEPLPLNDSLRDIETDSSFSLPYSVNIPPACVSPSPLEPEVLIACEPDVSAFKCTQHFDEGYQDFTVFEEKRSSGRTKKYSRSLDSRRTLLASPRRYSHPEPRVINIVTSEDGSRKGLTLVEELRQNLASKNYLPEVPYSSSEKTVIEETPEEHASKCSLLGALGLRSLSEVAALAQRKKEQALMVNSNNYTGTLKTVIKIQRPEKKGTGRMIYKASSSNSGTDTGTVEMDDVHNSIASPPSKESQESADEDAKNGKAKSLVIPEKASSFSIHPERMCSDVCTYCFGKFGLLDTPCHVAQLKDSEKRRNILETEIHLTLESCLCDACFRHVDKKSNGASMNEKKPDKRKLMGAKQARCCVLNCHLDGQHNVRRKTLLKLKRSLGKKLVLNEDKVDKMQPAYLVTLCNRHIYWVDYFMKCGICNKKLTSVNMFRVGVEVAELNTVLCSDGIPAVVTDKRFLCKMCHCYASVRLKNKDPIDMTPNQRHFYDDCRRRILRCYEIDVPGSEGEGNETDKNAKNKSQKKLKPSSTVTNGDMEVKQTKGPEEFSDVRANFQPLLDDDDQQGFHKCSTTIQFTKDSMELFYDLQRPYGNHSSFLRHLLLVEKYFRSGDLVLSRKADPQAVKYFNGVQNRLRSYGGTPVVPLRSVTVTPIPSARLSVSPPAPPPSTPLTVARVSSSPPAPAPAPPPPPPPPPSLTVQPASTLPSPLTQLQSTVHNIGMKPDISITSVGSEPRKLTPKIKENLRTLTSHFLKTAAEGETRAVILNRTVGGQKQTIVQVSTGGKTIHLTLAQFRRIQQLQLRRKQLLESQSQNQRKGKVNGPTSSNDSSDAINANFPNIPKALSVSVTKVPAPATDITQPSPKPD